MAANACVRPLTSDAAPTNARGSARYMYVGRGNLVSTARGTMRLVARLSKSRHQTRKVEGGSGGLRGPREGFRAVFRAQQWRVCTTPNQRRDRALGRILGGLRGLATGATRVGWWWGGHHLRANLDGPCEKAVNAASSPGPESRPAAKQPRQTPRGRGRWFWAPLAGARGPSSRARSSRRAVSRTALIFR